MIDGVLLPLYRAATTGFTPFARLLLNWRLKFGKEDPDRLDERLGFPSRPRDEGPLVWLHGASVGEGVALLTLAPRLTALGFRILLTTGTVTSAKVVGARLPSASVHQYFPLDAPAFMGRFLDHWRPDILLIAESELWPNMLAQASRRGVPIALVNARMSPRSFERWRRFPKSIGDLLGEMDVCLAQSEDDAQRLKALGAPRVLAVGNLKYDAPAPPADPVELAALAAAIGPRPIWLAASTHPGEEAAAFEIHRRLSGRFPDLLTVVAPRHIERGGEIAALAASRRLSAARRSRRDALGPGVDVYVADTMGESGLYYRLAGVVFVGKSLTASGGQNPIEPAKLGAAVLHGPHVSNFEDVYRDLDAGEGARMVADVDQLAETVLRLLSDVAALRRMGRAAAESVEKIGGATEAVVRALEPRLSKILSRTQ